MKRNDYNFCFQKRLIPIVTFLFLGSSIVSASDLKALEKSTLGLSIENLKQSMIRGRVMSAGESLPGVTVSIKDQPTQATATDMEGNFSLEAPVGSTLVFQMVGFETVEVSATSQTMTINMNPSITSLDEIVVTGYSTQKKENITASVATVDGDDLRDVSSPSVGNMLQGKVAGVDVVSSTGRPGDNPNIRIRGRSSIYSDISPLWVVDGVIQHGVPNINPNDVESMSVLKDAAATTQYGSRGTNGVIVVTTKRAKAGEGTLNVNLKSGISQFNHGNFKLMNSQQIYDAFQQFRNQSDIPANITEDVLANDFNWVDNGTQDAAMHDLSVSYVARTDKASVYFGGNYFTEEGTVKGYQYDRWAGRLNIDYFINDRITFKPKVNVTYTSNDNAQHSLYQMYLNLPWDNPFDPSGKLVTPRIQDINWYGRDDNNYLYDLQWNYGNGEIFDIQFNADFDVKISDHFTFVSTNNFAYYNSNSFSYTDPNSVGGLSTQGSVYTSNGRRNVRFTNQMLKFDRSFGDHNVNAFAAYEYMDYVYKDMGATGIGIVAGSEILNNTSEPQDISGTKNDYAANSGIINVAYNYADKYNAQASYRIDGSSRFGGEKQYGSFYAVSGAWNVHREDFFQSDRFDYLRLKASYGLVGNVPTALYGSYDLFNLNAQYNGAPAAYPGQLGNPLLTWETSKDFNLGLEFGLMGRFTFTADYYNKNTDGLLHFVALPATAGYSGYYENIGAVSNKGVEFAIGANIFSPESPFQWRLDVNFARNINRIEELVDGKDQPAGNKRYSEGRDIDSWYMRKWAGVDPENGDPLWETIDAETGAVTTTNNYNSASLQFVGTSTPDFLGGFASAMQFKNFYLNASFAFNKGAYAYNAGRELFDSDGAYPFYNQMVLQDGWSRWSESNPNATHPVAVYNGGTNSNKTSSRYLEDASFIRLRNVTLGYTFPESITSKLNVKGLGAYISGDNLWISTKFSGIDPEAALYGDATSQYPSPKRLTFGLNVSF